MLNTSREQESWFLHNSLEADLEETVARPKWNKEYGKEVRGRKKMSRWVNDEGGRQINLKHG